MATDDDQAGSRATQPQSRILCLTGPESTGKTTLAEALATHLGASLVPEVARHYLTGRADYAPDDVLEIARRQMAAEAAALTEAPEILICDTDLTVIQVWWEEKFGALPVELEAMLSMRSERAYLLLAPDLPWELDPLRENPEDLERLFECYRVVLESGKHGYRVVSGQGEARFEEALRAIEELSPGISD